MTLAVAAVAPPVGIPVALAGSGGTAVALLHTVHFAVAIAAAMFVTAAAAHIVGIPVVLLGVASIGGFVLTLFWETGGLHAL